MNVAASFYSMADFASKIGGDNVEVTCLVPPGTEPHVWLDPKNVKIEMENIRAASEGLSAVSPKVAQSIADAYGAEVMELNPIEGLSEQDIDAGEDYFSVMRENLNRLESVLA